MLRSPGLTPEQFGPAVDAARSEGIRVMGELGLFARVAAQLDALEDERREAGFRLLAALEEVLAQK